MILGGTMTLDFGYYLLKYLFEIADSDGTITIFTEIKKGFGFVFR